MTRYEKAEGALKYAKSMYEDGAFTKDLAIQDAVAYIKANCSVYEFDDIFAWLIENMMFPNG